MASLIAPAPCKLNTCQVEKKKKKIAKNILSAHSMYEHLKQRQRILQRNSEDLQFMSVHLNWQRASAKGSPCCCVLCASKCITTGLAQSGIWVLTALLPVFTCGLFQMVVRFYCSNQGICKGKEVAPENVNVRSDCQTCVHFKRY